MIGTLLGHHRILERIGAGGMGEVFLAHDERLERDVALKVLGTGALADESARRRFRKEALALSKLNHPNIETVHDFDTQDGIDFLVMEYIPGVTLSDELARGPMAERELLDLAVQLGEGLAAAHAQRVVHRDLKPGNLRIMPDGRLKILDFGLATLLAPETGAETTTVNVTETYAFAGTLPYMAPEQLRGADVDHRADIWATGVVLYEMATGRRPFEGKAPMATAADIQTQPPPLPSRLRPQLSPGLENIILKCLEKNPDLRYQSARDLVADFRRLNASPDSGTVKPPKSSTGPLAYALDHLRRGSRRAVWTLIAAFALTAIAILGFEVKRWWRPDTQAGTPKAITSLAVLPLRSLSASANDDYVIEGLHEALITELSKIGALRVISRTSTVRYTQDKRLLSQIGKELNVDAVMEGSVLRAGNRLRVSAQLVQIDPERHLWADSFDRELTDVLYLTSDVSQAVARQIRVTLTAAEKAHLARARQVNPEAYELYAVGRHHSMQRTLEGYEQAIESFRKALERDPGYAPVYAALADSYMLLGEQGGMQQNEARSLADGAIRKALELDTNLAEAQTSLGQWKFYYQWNWAEAEEAFKRAIQVNPGYAPARQFYGRTLGFLGRFDEGLRQLQQAREFDPLSMIVHAYIGQTYLFARQYDRGIEQLTSTLQLNPNHALVRHNLGEAYFATGRFPEAVEHSKKAVDLSREPSRHFLATLGAAYARAGRRRDALNVLNELTRQSTRGLVSAFDMAGLQAALGDNQTAIAWLEDGYAKRDVWLAELKGWPWLDALAPDPRFQAILRRMNFPH
jgi:serine/threonine protein kinase/tetratricopeptide (TPR) repeat protein